MLTPGDHAFIKSSWVESFLDNGEGVKSLPGPLYFPRQRAWIDRQLKEKLPNWTVACNTGDENQILGWSLVEELGGSSGLVIHYVYVKEPFRRRGLAKLLLGPYESAPVRHTHFNDTPPARKLAKLYGSKFDPFFLR